MSDMDIIVKCNEKTLLQNDVTGLELIGLVQKKVLIDAGKYVLQQQSRALAIPERDSIQIAFKTCGLDELQPVNQDGRIIE